jgi:hypothetical protein
MPRNFSFTPEVLGKNFNNILTLNFNPEFCLILDLTTLFLCKVESLAVYKNAILSAFNFFTYFELPSGGFSHKPEHVASHKPI